ncbi:MAG: glycerate kinase [Deltaproteobacteria bacterium]|nr:glycerate kinase [Deltaproteobacteria bacterium]
MKKHAQISRNLFFTALRAVDPFESVQKRCDAIRAAYHDGGFTRLVAVGFGKAAASMALALEQELGDILESGVFVTKYGHTTSRKPEKFRIFQAGHPVPDENGLRGTEEIMELTASADEKTLVVTLVSGGGSALLVAPAGQITLAAKQLTTDLLLRCGADIHELNTVRKHLSRVKGGRLAGIINPASTISLILSDVIGDDLDVIASGPTAADSSTYREAIAVLERYQLQDQIPAEVAAHLALGARGDLPETPKAGDPVFQRVENHIIGSNRLALEAMLSTARNQGLAAEILSTRLSGEAADAAKMLARTAIARKETWQGQPLCLLSGGETVVHVRGNGRGGRNMELALNFALEIAGTEGITLLSAGTDGSDGPTDAAGALVDGKTITATERERALRFLENNDSYSFFQENGGLFITGPTGTNIMDLQILLVGE